MSKELVVVFTGAGISAESGLKTFRDSDGLWEQYSIEDVATPEAFQRNPELVLRFYNERRKQVLNTQPNRAHKAIADLEKKYDVVVVTQNIDDLHERAGSSKVIHVHGEILKARCTGPCNHIIPWKKDINLGDTCENGYQLRPHVVWFGEPVLHLDEAFEWASKADKFMIVGTSLVVYPAAGIVFHVRPSVPIYIVDPADVMIPTLPNKVIHIKKRATEGVPEVIEKYFYPI